MATRALVFVHGIARSRIMPNEQIKDNNTTELNCDNSMSAWTGLVTIRIAHLE